MHATYTERGTAVPVRQYEPFKIILAEKGREEGPRQEDQTPEPPPPTPPKGTSANRETGYKKANGNGNGGADVLFRSFRKMQTNVF